MMHEKELVLSEGSARVVIDLACGGRIAELSVNGLTLLVDREENPLAWGSYPMAPWAGRVRDGRFSFKGREYALPLNMASHAIHGTTFNSAWQHEGGGRLVCPLGRQWPWPGRAIQDIALDENGLDLRLEVQSDEEAFPASIGWHPWFRRRLQRGEPAMIRFDAEAMYACDESGIPTGERVKPPAGPWDDCFVGVVAPPEIFWPGALKLQIQSSVDHWVVYSQPEHAICIEPMTGPPNALNSGAQIVEPGRPLIATTRLSWQALS